MTKSIRKPWTNITRCYVAMLIKHGSSVTDDQLFEKLAGEAGLYGVAFFGHHAKPGDRKLLSYLWKISRKIAKEIEGTFALNSSWVHGKFDCGIIDTHLGTVEVFAEDWFAQGDDAAKAIDEIHKIWLAMNVPPGRAFEIWVSNNF